MHDFFARNYRVYGSNFSPAMRYCLTIALCFALVAVWHFSINLFMHKRIANQKALIQQCSHCNEAIKHELSKSEELQESIAHIKSKFEAAIPYSTLQQSDAMMSLIFNAASTNNLVMQSYVPQGVQDKKWYTKHSCTTEFTGNYSAIISFFTDLKNAKQLIKCSMVKLSKVNDQLLQVQCQFDQLKIKVENNEA